MVEEWQSVHQMLMLFNYSGCDCETIVLTITKPRLRSLLLFVISLYSQMLGDGGASLSSHPGCQGIHFLETVAARLPRATVGGANEATSAAQDGSPAIQGHRGMSP